MAELDHTLGRIDGVQADSLIGTILSSQTIFVAGAGRSGFAMKAFGMRLMHMGVDAFVVGETVTPNITKDDMLVIGSGSGSTGSLVAMAQKAQSIGARVALITTQSDSPIGRLSDTVLTIPAPTPKIASDTGYSSIQPMGSLFEQCLFLVLDAVVFMLMSSSGRDSEQMFIRHANLE